MFNLLKTVYPPSPLLSKNQLLAKSRSLGDSLWQLQARTSDSGVIRQTRWSRAVLLLIQKIP